ncbi:hydroxyacid dehydrogenase [Psychromonas sp. psych-6C06]|uniref:D-2-hydroxyacid dehydrogenase n=1 Tax=Psychromonas sp. psych-6C06 TaxID=2058089 RepID=UPI000C323293|nr:D-2-hydroxyacid dehydrogenase [Psychromonas sp. psych-6C06]PKF63333.1 hydroxyacid dehydrogenase [Psychromonas sp. psych-6C06]
MKIVLLDALTLGDSDLSEFDYLGEFTRYDITEPEQRLAHISDNQVIITNKVVIDEAIILANPQLKLICIAATGMNNVDLLAAEKANVEVKNVSGYSTESVAQATFAMLFQLLHQQRYYDAYVTQKQWCESPNFTHISRPFTEISGKRWGIIGLGDIGKRVASLATAFGCDVCYFSTSGKNNQSEYQQVDLNTLLSLCDIITIHAPLNEQTQDLIDVQALQLLKPGAIILNLGRGGIIDETAMAVALDTRDIYHGSDVLAVEPMAQDHIYFNVQQQHRLVLTPHTAWASSEARKSLVAKIVDNIISWQGRNA